MLHQPFGMQFAALVQEQQQVLREEWRYCARLLRMDHHCHGIDGFI
jgi:hypothetical protein